MSPKLISLCLFSWFLIPFVSYSQQKELRLTLKNSDNSYVPFASILGVDEKIGAVSNENGNAKFIIDHNKDNLKLYISSVGYKDTLVNLSVSNSSKFDVILEKEILILNEVSVNAERMIEKHFGNKNDDIFKKGDEFRTIDTRSVGEGVGNIYKNNLKDGYLESIDIYFINEKPVKYLLKFYKLDNFNEYFLNIPQDNLETVFNENLIIKSEKRGWLNYDLSSYNIAIPDSKYIVAVLVQIDGDFTKNEHGFISLDIAMQKGKRNENVIFFTSDYFTIFSKKHDKMAIVLNCSEIK